MFNRSILPLVVVFLIVSVVILLLRNSIEAHGLDWQVLMGGNLFIYFITTVSMHLLTKGLVAEKTHSFLSHSYGAIMLKLFACAAAVFIYVWLSGKAFNKGSLFICMGLYLVYTYFEFTGILKQSRKNKNVKG